MRDELGDEKAKNEGLEKENEQLEIDLEAAKKEIEDLQRELDEKIAERVFHHVRTFF